MFFTLVYIYETKVPKKTIPCRRDLGATVFNFSSPFFRRGSRRISGSTVLAGFPLVSFSSFINCIHNTDSSCKSLVRKQCIALLSLFSRYHGDSLSPHLSKMVSTVIRRLRDPDSSVRSTCATATADMSAHVKRQPFASVAKPLIVTLIQEGDSNAQIRAALYLVASVEAASDPESEQLRKALPKIGKLLKSEGFKAKSALLSVVGCIISPGGAGTKAVLDWLVPVLIEFLSSNDWTTRKSAAEALGKVATTEELASQYKKACTTALESRRFDKVKSVRETMNRVLNLWKDVPNEFDEASLSPYRSFTLRRQLYSSPPYGIVGLNHGHL